MKRIIIFSFISLFALSCSEYDDDGLPSEPGNIVITNPDGTKKIKKIVTRSTGTSDMNVDFGSMDMEISSETIFATDSYSRETTVTNNSTGAEGSYSSVSNSSETWDGYKFMKMAMNENATSNSIYNFTYTEDQLSSFSNTSSDARQGTGTVITTEDQITVTSTSDSDYFFPTTSVFNLTDGYISSAEITNTRDNSVYNITFSRSNANITQLIFNTPVGDKTYNYTYDASVNPFHLAYENASQQTFAEIARLISSGYDINIHEGNMNINSVESSFRNMLAEGRNNLVSSTSGNETLITSTYTYDDDNYPIAISSEGSSEVSLGGIMQEMISAMVAVMEAMGLSQEEIDATVAEMQEELSNGILINLSTTAEITYYE